jgi:hypothetical protein
MGKVTQDEVRDASATCLMFSELQPSTATNLQMASPTVPSWNQLQEWLRSMDRLRIALSGRVA